MTDAAALTSRIERVTVYREGALVRRVASLPDVAIEQARVLRLPLTLDDASVRARVDGVGAFVRDVRVVIEVPPADASLLPPRDEELRAARLEVASLRANIERVNAAIGRVGTLSVAPRPEGRRGEAPIASPFDARRALMTLRTTEHERLCAELSSLEASLVSAVRRQAVLADRAARATSARNPKEHELFKSVVVTLSPSPAAAPSEGGSETEGASPAGGALLSVEYVVPGARWTPSYALALGPSYDDAELTVRAAVAQRTGEDWTDALLVLSTADPARWTDLPELQSTRVGRVQPRRTVRGWRDAPEGARELYADYERAFGVVRPLPPPAAFGPPPMPVAPSPAMSPPGGIPYGQAAAAPLGSPVLPPSLDALSPARARSSGPLAFAGELLRSAVPAPSAAVAPRRERVAGAAAAAEDLGRPVATKRPPAPPDPIEPARGALAYGKLRMPAPSSDERGALVVASAAALYAESVNGSMTLDVALFASIDVAIRQATIREPLPPGHAPVAAIDDFDFAYETTAPASVPSDGVFHVVAVATMRAPTSIRYVAVPREAREVFRVLELTAPIDAALPAGPVDVYRSGTYLMTGRVPPTAPRAVVRLGLGVEPAIKVAHNTRFAEQPTGLLGGGLALAHELRVDVSNVLGHPVDLEVRERIPVARKDDEDVSVEITSVEPAWGAYSQGSTLEGGHRWRVALGAGEKRALVASYVVKLSSKRELVGGNRREP